MGTHIIEIYISTSLADWIGSFRGQPDPDPWSTNTRKYMLLVKIQYCLKYSFKKIIVFFHLSVTR